MLVLLPSSVGLVLKVALVAGVALVLGRDATSTSGESKRHRHPQTDCHHPSQRLMLSCQG